jgi:hypothetical protein
MWASPYCTQSLFLWYNSAQSENYVSIVWSNVQVQVHIKLWMVETNYNFTQQCPILYTMHHTPQHGDDYEQVTRKHYSLTIMENVRNWQVSGMEGAVDKTKSPILSLLYRQTNQQLKNLPHFVFKKTLLSDWEIAHNSNMTDSEQSLFNSDSDNGNTVYHCMTTHSQKLWQRCKQRYWHKVSKKGIQ